AGWAVRSLRGQWYGSRSGACATGWPTACRAGSADPYPDDPATAGGPARPGRRAAAARPGRGRDGGAVGRRLRTLVAGWALAGVVVYVLVATQLGVGRTI